MKTKRMKVKRTAKIAAKQNWIAGLVSQITAIFK